MAQENQSRDLDDEHAQPDRHADQRWRTDSPRAVPAATRPQPRTRAPTFVRSRAPALPRSRAPRSPRSPRPPLPALPALPASRTPALPALPPSVEGAKGAHRHPSRLGVARTSRIDVRQPSALRSATRSRDVARADAQTRRSTPANAIRHQAAPVAMSDAARRQPTPFALRRVTRCQPTSVDGNERPPALTSARQRRSTPAALVHAPFRDVQQRAPANRPVRRSRAIPERFARKRPRDQSGARDNAIASSSERTPSFMRPMTR
jgi:hypothetical protein